MHIALQIKKFLTKFSPSIELNSAKKSICSRPCTDTFATLRLDGLSWQPGSKQNKLLHIIHNKSDHEAKREMTSTQAKNLLVETLRLESSDLGKVWLSVCKIRILNLSSELLN